MNNLFNYKLLLLGGALLTAGCSKEEAPAPINPADDPNAIELGITAGVTLTKSAIQGGSGAQSGTGDDVMQAVAVYAMGAAGNTSYADNTANFYALYAQKTGADAGKWENTGTDKIYLTHEKAAIYAFHPAYAPGTGGVMASSGTALKINGTATSAPTAAATINITVFAGTAGADGNNKLTTANNAEKIWGGTTWKTNDGAGKDKINSAKGEVDYMWATPVTDACNGKASGTAANTSVALKMNHALSMISFRIYNNGTYKNAGSLTKIKLEGMKGNTGSIASGSPTMKIADGTVTNLTTPSATTFTRFIEGGYAIPKAATSGTPSATLFVDATEANLGNASTEFSILVYPFTGSIDSSWKVTFTIDGADYPVTLTNNGTGQLELEPGKNNLYTAKLSGAGLEISSVTVAPWGAGKSGSLVVN